jgi:hypothetical protein
MNTANIPHGAWRVMNNRFVNTPPSKHELLNHYRFTNLSLFVVRKEYIMKVYNTLSQAAATERVHGRHTGP